MKKGIFQHPEKLDQRRKLRNNATETEQILWSRLRKKGIGGYKFIRQYSVGCYILDFYCPRYRLAVEVDGSQHGEPENQVYDEVRTKFLESQGIEVIRFWNAEIYHRIEDVCSEILFQLEQRVKKF